MWKRSVELTIYMGLTIVTLASAALVAVQIWHGVGNPILVVISSCFVLYNTWAFKSGRAMYFGIGVSSPDAGNAPRMIKLVGMWVIYMGFLLEQTYSLMQIAQVLA